MLRIFPVLCCFFCAPAVAAGLGFSDVCPGYLRDADDFSVVCSRSAREQTRLFFPSGRSPGQPETHSIYFAHNDIASHFGLGCMLDRNHVVRFVGVYYSTEIQDFGNLNSLPIKYIDFSGNAGFERGDGEVIVWAVRPFVTNLIKAQYQYDFDANCDDPRPALDEPHMIGGNNYEFSTTSYRDSLEVRACLATEKKPRFCVQEAYLSYFANERSKVLYNFGTLAIIRYSGELDVRENTYVSGCTSMKIHPATPRSLITNLCAK